MKIRTLISVTAFIAMQSTWASTYLSCKKIFVEISKYEIPSKERYEEALLKLKEFNKNEISAMETSKMKKLPKGKLGNRKAWTEIYNFMNDHVRVFRQIQELETEVINLSKAKKIKNYEALVLILEKWEKNNGFKKSFDLEDKAYSTEEWYQMLSEGALFNDTVFVDKNRNGRRHAYLTHRLQWHVIMREIRDNPEKFQDEKTEEPLKASALYKDMGNRKSAANLSWEKTGVEIPDQPDHLWFYMFDDFNQGFTSPEAFRSYHNYWPGLGDWY